YLRVAAEDALLLQRLPHRGGGRTGPRDEEQVGARVLRLLRERREVVRRQRHEDLRDLVPLAAEQRIDGGEVARAERRVLREDDDLLARALEEAVRREHVLGRL